MKNNSRKEKSKRHYRRKATKILRRTRRLRKNKKKSIIYKKHQTPGRKVTEAIKAPEDFSIVNNTENMLKFFECIRKRAKIHEKIEIDISGIETMSADAILYTIAFFNYCSKKYKTLDISGNIPNKASYHKQLAEAGYFTYVKCSKKTKCEHTFCASYVGKKSGDTLSIKYHTKVEAGIADEVLDFTKKHLNLERSDKTKRIYKILIECMGNTRNHAYLEENKSSKWYLMALRKPDESKINFAFFRWRARHSVYC